MLLLDTRAIECAGNTELALRSAFGEFRPRMERRVRRRNRLQ